MSGRISFEIDSVNGYLTTCMTCVESTSVSNLIKKATLKASLIAVC